MKNWCDMNWRKWKQTDITIKTFLTKGFAGLLANLVEKKEDRIWVFNSSYVTPLRDITNEVFQIDSTSPNVYDCDNQNTLSQNESYGETSNNEINKLSDVQEEEESESDDSIFNHEW